MVVETGTSTPSGDHQVASITATAVAPGDAPGEDEIKLSPPDLEGFGRQSSHISAVEIQPVTDSSVSQSVDTIIDAPNVASMTIESRPADCHETTVQDPEQIELAHPSSIVRTSAPTPGDTPASHVDILLTQSPTAVRFSLPTRSNTDFTASFPQSSTSGMIFANGARAAHRRRSLANTSALTEYEADLTSKDRLKQKEAVRNMLASKVRTDWSFPDKVDQLEPELSNALPESDPAQPTEWIERGDWLSELSSSDDSDGGLEQTSSNSTTGNEKVTKTKVAKKKRLNIFRFDSPDDVGETVRRRADRRKLRQQRKLHEELAYNEGLRCFTARRNAWTNARVVKRTRDSSCLSNSPTTEGKPAALPEAEEDEPILDTLLPIAPPLLPPDTPMRRNITSRAHSTIYDKVILQSQTPLCPINLQTVVSSCVEGWKRDGEWPPKGTEPETALRRRDSAAAGAGAAQKGVWRRSLQKVFGRAEAEIL